MLAHFQSPVASPVVSELPIFVWDLSAHPVSLGGALTLRAEAELLAQAKGVSTETPIRLWLREGNSGDKIGPMLLRRVFLTSAYNFLVETDTMLPRDETWPDALCRGDCEFSYHGYGRVTALHAEIGLAPRLRWSMDVQQSAHRLRRFFGERLFCVHLRNTGGGVEESNAEFVEWRRFFSEQARPGSQEFLLLGDDPPDDGATPVDGVHRAADLDIDLTTQLALVEQSDGYLGMASGVGCAANFSEAPHVLFKHPAHHAAAMQVELGNADRYPFFNDHQALWRREADFTALQEAFAFIRS